MYIYIILIEFVSINKYATQENCIAPCPPLFFSPSNSIMRLRGASFTTSGTAAVNPPEAVTDNIIGEKFSHSA